MESQSKSDNPGHSTGDGGNSSMEGTAADESSQSSICQKQAYKEFEKKPRSFSPSSKDFTKTIRYQDADSYTSQRHHYIGQGLFNTDEIEDLPPRYRTKVLKVYDNLLSHFASKYPEDFSESKNPRILNIIDLNEASSLQKQDSGIQSSNYRTESVSRDDSLQGERSHLSLNDTFIKRQNSSSDQRVINNNKSEKSLQNSFKQNINTDKSNYSKPPSTSKIQQHFSKDEHEYCDKRHNARFDEESSSTSRTPAAKYPDDFSESNKVSTFKKQGPKVKPFKDRTESISGDDSLQNKRGNHNLNDKLKRQNSSSDRGFSNNKSENSFQQNINTDKSKYSKPPSTPKDREHFSKVEHENSDKRSNARCDAERPSTSRTFASKYHEDFSESNKPQITALNKVSTFEKQDSKIKPSKHRTESVSRDDSLLGERSPHSFNDKFIKRQNSSSDRSVISNNKNEKSLENSFKQNINTDKSNYSKPPSTSKIQQHFSKDEHEYRDRRYNARSDKERSSPSRTLAAKYTDDFSESNRVSTFKKQGPKVKPLKDRTESISGDNLLQVNRDKHSLDHKFINGQNSFSDQSVFNNNTNVKSLGNSSQQNINTIKNKHSKPPSTSKNQEHLNKVEHENYDKRSNAKCDKEWSSTSRSSKGKYLYNEGKEGNSQNISASSINTSNSQSKISQFRNSRPLNKDSTDDSSSVKSDSSYISLSKIRHLASQNNKQRNENKSNDKFSEARAKSSNRFAQVAIPFEREREPKHSYVAPRNIKKTKDPGFFVTINVSEKADDVKFWLEFLQNVLKHKDFSLNYCCKFSESLILNFHRKIQAQKAVPILRKLKNATKNLRQPHIILVSNFKNHLIRPCDCSGSMFESCKKYFKDFAERFLNDHKDKIFELRNEMKELKNVKERNLKELKLSLSEKLDILEKMLFTFKDYVSLLEEKLSLHEKFAVEGNLTLKEKYILKDDEFFELTVEERLALKQLIRFEEEFSEGKISLEEMEEKRDKLNSEVKLPTYSVYLAIRKLKKMFMYECNSFQRCLPVYSKKNEVLNLIQKFSVLVISAETGSGKTTQLAEYLLQSKVAERGTIICTQPRKVAAVSVTNFVCGQIGTAVGKVVGYDVGTEKKYDKDTKVIYMTDYALLKKMLRNRKLRGVSCVIIDEAHERTLYTDLLLGMLKSCLIERLDLRLIVTSATIDPLLFVEYFGENQSEIIEVPGRTYPVKVHWLEKDVEIGWDYVKECVKTAKRIHEEESEGDILVFLTSPGEIDDAVMMFKDIYEGQEMPELMSLHGKSDLKEQLLVFQTTPNNSRKIIFATNAAETSLTIPGIKYVIDSGMAKEMTYFPEKNKSCLLVTFVNKSSAEQRKGRAGRTQPGVCYRMYSKNNYEDMIPTSTPEILKTNLQRAMLKLYQFGIEPRKFDFVESPPNEAVIKSLESLEYLGLIKEIKDQRFCLTDVGKRAVELPVDPHLAKLVLEGIEAEIGYETIIMAALVNEAGRLFFRPEHIKERADRKKKEFCQTNGDLCTYLEIYKRWLEVPKEDRYNWCVENYINSKALNSATKTIQEIMISLHQELSVRVRRRYNNQAFNSHYERIIFNCFSENLCTYSGHPKTGYFSPYFTENLFIHPSSSLQYLKIDNPIFLVYSTLMQTSRNFLLDVTPIKEEVLKQAFHDGTFHLQVDMLKKLQILPKTLGPFGESVLVRHILGKDGKKIYNLEKLVERLINSRNFKIDVHVEKGIITIYLEKRYHETVSHYIYEMVEDAHTEMRNEEETVEMKGSFCYFYLGAGGVISDIIMPGEFKELTVDCLKLQSRAVEESLKSFGAIQSLKFIELRKNSYRIAANYVKAASAQKAMTSLSQQRGLKVKSNICASENLQQSLPLFKILVKWCRCPATGKGWIVFPSEADCIAASGKLTKSPLYIDKNCIRFTPTEREKILDMSNLPSYVDENMIRKKLQEVLPDVIKLENIDIHITRKKTSITEKDVELVKCELDKLFKTSDLIDVKYPNLQSTFWIAIIYFKKWEVGERAFMELHDKAEIRTVPLQLKVLKESNLLCKTDVYKVIKEEMHFIEERFKDAKFMIVEKSDRNMTDIIFSCKSMKELYNLRLELSQLLQGKTINCLDKRYHYLFTIPAQRRIMKIQNKTKTEIISDDTRKLITIFGPKNNCLVAYDEICSLVTENILSKKKVYNLKSSSLPKGFLKSIYSKFGLDLKGLINELELREAYVHENKLIIKGTESNLEKAERHLESICEELYQNSSEAETDEEKDTCPICLDPLGYDCYRLEHCGHGFCKECLLLQIESKTIPLVCIKSDCGKLFYLLDIKRLLSRCAENVKRAFHTSALQYHINQSGRDIFYCPSPDCHWIYRKSDTGVQHLCRGCGNDICLRCQSFYHHGMSCDMFQKSATDEDISLKTWMEEDKAMRKQCPYCQAPIEKIEGCNHMHCKNCYKHLCWLCLKVFEDMNEVYDHQPYCPNNQTPN